TTTIRTLGVVTWPTRVESTALVLGAALHLTVPPLSVVEGHGYDGPVARFTSDDPSATFDQFWAWIDWGNGDVTAGSIAPDALGGFTVSGTGLYREEGSSAGDGAAYSKLRVTVWKGDTSRATAEADVIVTPADL